MKRIALLDPALVQTVFRQLPVPNTTRASWKQTVHIFKQHNLYQGEPAETVEQDLKLRFARAAEELGAECDVDHVERQLWLTLTETLRAQAALPSALTGIVTQPCE